MSASDFQPGVVIDDRYKVLSRIGAGGMSDVYLAEDQQLGRQVALKLLHRRFAADPGFVERFRREAQAAASLQHPNVVSVFDRGDFDDTYYIAMEYLAGRSLKQLIRDDAPLEQDRAIDLTIQILKAARFAHRSGVIHRDLKPHNVIVDEGDHAKVTDFGIARAGASDMTETGSIMGTAQYLSPEQAQGHAVSGPSDLYSVGIILYEMLTGQLPFDGESPVAIALKQVSEAPVPPRGINPSISPALEQVVLWSLNKNPGDRPATADEFIEALENARGSNAGTTQTLPAVVASPYVGPVASAPEPPAELVPVAYPYGSAENLMLSGEHFGQPPGDSGSRERPVWPWIVGLLVLVLIVGGVLAYIFTRPAKVLVPGVDQLSLAVAETRIEAVGLTPNVTYITNTATSGTVIGTYPDGGTRVKQGSTVLLSVSSGPANVSVPPVVQLSAKAATKALKKVGLNVSKVLSQASSAVKKGDVVTTDPSAGSSVTAGSGVTLYLSSGPASSHKVKIPSVQGLTLTAAQAALQAFTVVFQNEQTTAIPANTAMGTEPPAGTLVPSGSVVTLTVSVAPSKVPSVVGDTEAAARSTLTGDGYGVTKALRLTTNPSENGIVLKQSPRAGKALVSTGFVTITVGQYEATTSTLPATTTTPTTAPTDTTTTP